MLAHQQCHRSVGQHLRQGGQWFWSATGLGDEDARRDTDHHHYAQGDGQHSDGRDRGLQLVHQIEQHQQGQARAERDHQRYERQNVEFE